MDQSSRSSCTSTGSFVFVKQEAPVDGENWLNDDDDLKIYAEIFEKARSQIPDELTINIISEAEALKIVRRPPATVFVMSFFEGRAYEYLISLKCCIVGPPLVLSYIRRKKPLPKSVRPIYSDIMKGVVICCTGVERHERECIFQLVEFMSGNFKRDLEQDCNVLIANDVSSQKYQVSCEKNILVVNSKWVFDVWRRVATNDDVIAETFFDPRSPDYCSSFKCPIFQNLIITVSGLKAEERLWAEKLITENGGTYKSDLINGECTHLISTSTESAKYKAAVRWKILVVHKRWLEDSVASGYCRNPERYPVDMDSSSFAIPQKSAVLPETQKMSTPTNAGAHIARLSSIMDIENMSAIPNHHHQLTDFDATTVTSVAGNRTMTSSDVYKIGETIDSSGLSKGAGGNSKEKSIVPETADSDFVKRRNGYSRTVSQKPPENTAQAKILRANSSNTLSSRDSTKHHDKTPKDANETEDTLILQDTPLEDLDLTITTSGQFLTSCRIFILPNQFSAKESEKLKRMINAGCGRRCSALTSAVSHVIVPESYKELNKIDPNVTQNLKKLISLSTEQNVKSMVKSKAEQNEKPHQLAVVTATWLVHCFKRGKLLDTKNYSHPKFNNAYLYPGSNNDDKEDDEQLESAKSGFTSCTSATISPIPLKKVKSFEAKNPLAQFDDILSQYMEDEDDRNVKNNRSNVERMDVDVDQDDTKVAHNLTDRRKNDDHVTTIANDEQTEKITREESANASLHNDDNKDKKMKNIGDDWEWDTPGKFMDPNKTFHPKFDLTEARQYLNYCKDRNQQKLQLGESPSVVIERQLAKAVKATEQAPVNLGTPMVPRKRTVLVKGLATNGETREVQKNIANGSPYASPLKRNEFITAASEKSEKVTEPKDRVTSLIRRAISTTTPTTGTEIHKANLASILSDDNNEPSFVANRSATVGNLGSFASRKKSESAIDTVTAVLNADETSKQASSIVSGVFGKSIQSDFASKLIHSDSKKHSSILDLHANQSRDDDQDSDDADDVGSNASKKSSLPPLRLPAQSQAGFQIGWEDPIVKQSRPKAQPMRKRCSEPTQSQEDDIVMIDTVKVNPKVNSSICFNRKRQTMHFLTTSVDSETKALCLSVIQSMDARISDTTSFDPSCTHVIVGKPSRNEKLLSSIANGKWILHPSYLMESKKAGKFLDEEDFEWGGEGTRKYLAELPDLGKNLALSCIRWRQIVARTNRKAYENFKALLLVDKEMENGLKNLLRFGGGTLCDKNTPHSEITHVFYKESKSKGGNNGKNNTSNSVQTIADLKRFKSLKVKCYKPEYLAAFLTDNPLNEKNYLL